MPPVFAFKRLFPQEPKRLLPFVFAAVMGLSAVALMRQYLVQQYRKLEAERRKVMELYQNPVEVVVASRDLEKNLALEARHLALATVPEQFVQPYSARSMEELVGLVTVAPMAEGEQILANKLRRPEERSGEATLATLMPKDKRAVTIGVDAITGVGGFVRPGDTVDILWTIQLPQPGQQEGQLVTLTLFQDVPVLAVGSALVGQGSGAPQSNEYSVTLALTPQETSFLLLAREQGRIQLSLRPEGPEGSAQVAVAPANIASLLEAQLGIMSGQPPVQPPRLIEVYKGLQREIVAIAEGPIIEEPLPGREEPGNEPSRVP